MLKNTINDPLTLPCGVRIKNRLGKSAMSENMGTPDYKANHKFVTLYNRWAHSGAGLLITGNVMIDKTALGEPGNIVIEGERDYSDLKLWAQAATQNNTQAWVQINHPGKQSPKFLSPHPVAPSAVGLKPPLNKFFNTPRELTEDEIENIILKFAHAAKISKQCGFSGVQIHGAHSYLVSQFLSPHHNKRTDKWGGSLENRMRFVSRIYDAIRNEVGPEFPVGIKMNSADFQRGGFTHQESMFVAQYLSEKGMDLIEISGGNYESPKMVDAKQSTIQREAYFQEYCADIRKVVKSPLMLTGGFRSLKAMNAALEDGTCDMIGLARSMVLNLNFPNELLNGHDVKSIVKQLSTGIKYVDKLFPFEIIWYTQQIHTIAQGLDPKPNKSVMGSILKSFLTMGAQNLKRLRA